VSGFGERFRMQRQEDTKMKTVSLALALASILFGFVPAARAQTGTGADRRGAVEVQGHTVKAVTVGPAIVHGYSGFSGGALFVAPVADGTDADCATALANPTVRTMPLVADRMAYLPIGAGQVACLVTDTQRPFELLWHAFATDGTQTLLASAKTPRATTR
jgi:hypothetical protein